MGLQVIAAATALPEARRQTAHGGLMSCARPVGANDEFAVDYAKRASLSALGAAGVSPLDIGLLISKGISPSHVAESPEIMGPRVGHALQYALGADNAFVFDMVEADWGSVLDSADALLSGLDRDVALLVHSELSGPSIEPDRDSGFALSDGAGVLLVVRDGPLAGASTYANIQTSGIGARLWMKDAAVADEQQTWVALEWKGSSDLPRAIGAALSEAIRAQADVSASQTRRALDVEPAFALAIESWFPGHQPQSLGMRTAMNPTPPPFGALTVPYVLADQAWRAACATLLIACVDPFRLRSSCRAVRMHSVCPPVL